MAITDRRGKIVITNDYFETQEGFLILRELFSQFYPEMIVQGVDKREYYGISKLFDEVGKYDNTPMYDTECTLLEGTPEKAYYINFKRL